MTAKRMGSLTGVHPMDLGVHGNRELVQRNAIPAADYDHVRFGAMDANVPQAGNLARSCWLGAGLTDQVPGVTVDRQRGSSQQRVYIAVKAVMSGTQGAVLAAGVQNMSCIPISTAL